MTSSATQTERPPAGEGAAGAGRQVADRRERVVRWLAGHTDAVSSGVLLVGGWLLILFVNRWHVGAPSIFLCLGWLSILLAGRALWRAASVAGEEAPGRQAELAGFEVTRTRREDLEREKRALLKAIKEVEFDRDMGKMSEADAAEIVRVYRGRAIEILKELDHQAEDGGGAEPVSAGAMEPIDRIIEREVRARMALAGVRPKKAAEKKAGGAAEKEAESEEAGKGEKKAGGAEKKAGGAKGEKAEKSDAKAEKFGGKTEEKSDAKAEKSDAKAEKSAAKAEESEAKAEESEAKAEKSDQAGEDASAAAATEPAAGESAAAPGEEALR